MRLPLYRIRGATDEEKSKLLKDILSFANTHRKADAYILIGVQEVKGGRSEVVGISEDIDDADLQQLINSKTNRRINFSYKATQYNEFKVGIIHIPVQIQERPFFSTRDFGIIRKNEVYIRQGSSNAIATPDEIISMMGRKDIDNDKEIPSFDVFLVSGQHDEIVEKQINCKLINA
jgi:predicted HTH transcriptional regulator